MIIDVLESSERYEALSAYFSEAFAFLRRKDLAQLADGEYEINGRKVFATVVHKQGIRAEEGKLEAHDNYIDIQFVIQGVESMGWKARGEIAVPCVKPEEYDDVFFYDDVPASWNTVHSGAFAIFFPEDAHMPLVSEGAIHKVIVKVAIA